MAHIAKRNGRWQAAYRTPDKRERTRTFDRRVDAERWLATIQADQLRGTYVDPAEGRRLFRDYAREWQRGQVHRPTTVQKVESDLTNHILPFLRDRPLAAIRPSEIQSWVRDRSAVLGPASVEVVYRCVAAIFLSAVADRL
jgi:hypothetical protein